MTTISVNYAAMGSGHQGLVATWGRIESHLSELDQLVAGTGDMRADALQAYAALKMRWAASAADHQQALRALAGLVDQAAERYRQVDTALAAQFE